MLRHVRESGTGGIHFMPRAPDDPAAPPGPAPDALARPLTEPGWQRWWIAVAVGGDVIGHCDLKGPRLETELHRAVLGIGLETPYRRRGLGTALILEAIEFAQAAETIDWVDLGVFGNNEPALALYRWIGFRQTGVIPDRFRIAGQSVDDVQMTLAVRASGREP